MKQTISTTSAPTPQGTYAQAVRASGEMIFVSGQTPRTNDGVLLRDVSFAEMAEQTMDNLNAIVLAAGCTIPEHCVKVTVYLSDLNDRHDFDRVFAKYTGGTPPARAIVQSDFIDFRVEVDAILVK